MLGASDMDHHAQDTLKLKLVLDLGESLRASYVAGLFLDDSRANVDSYLRDAAGTTVYTSGFNSGFYVRENRHWAHALSLDSTAERFDWQLIGTLYDYARDRQANPTTLLPAAAAGGVGSVQDQSGTGWITLDGKAILRGNGHAISLGGHFDRYTLQSQTFGSSNWRAFNHAALVGASQGKTRTAAVWLQDEVELGSRLTATLGVRQEWWRAYDGFNKTSAASPGLVQTPKQGNGFSPKMSMVWTSGQWDVRLSLAQAWRFPTVGELYGAVTVGSVLANPNPGLRPERARSAELAISHRDEKGGVRVSLFNEIVDDALISQTGPVAVIQPGGATLVASASFVQNIDRTLARGVEIAFDRHDLVPGIDASASVTYADAITARNAAFPASVGKLLPSVPHWKANAVATWRANHRLSLTAAARLSSRNYATLDNSDIFADTYQGFDKYFVVDLRATYKVDDHVELALGADNINNHRYFLFHPFPQRSVTAEVRWTL